MIFSMAVLYCSVLIVNMCILETSSLYVTCKQAFDLEKRPTLIELKSTKTSDIIECLSYISKKQLPSAETVFVWRSIVKHFDGIPSIPESVLMSLQWVTPAISAEEYANMTLDDIDVIRNFGLDYNLVNEQLFAVADRVRADFAGKMPEDYTCYDLTALRNILCAFDASEIDRIHASAYKEAANVIGNLKCSPEVMSAFAQLAMHRDAFGSPLNWSDAVIGVVGEVVKYLPTDLADKILARRKYKTII